MLVSLLIDELSEKRALGAYTAPISQYIHWIVVVLFPKSSQ
jgi:hypothetical protein